MTAQMLGRACKIEIEKFVLVWLIAFILNLIVLFHDKKYDLFTLFDASNLIL